MSARNTIKQHQNERVKKIQTRMLAVMGVIAVIGMLVCGYGHAAVNSDLYIEGTGTVAISKGFTSTHMQDMTPTECSEADIYTTGQFIDRRDGQKYWVTKMADGNCWMTQNLQLELSVADTLLTPELSDVESDWVPKFDTLNTVATTYVKDEGRTFFFDGYIMINPATTASCGTGKANPSQCPNQVIAVGDRTPSDDPNFYTKNGATYNDTEYDAHYLLGVYYQQSAATAGTGAAAGTAPSSVCPRGWTLPTEAQFRGIPMTYSGEALLPPYFYTTSGYVAGANKLAYVGYRNSSIGAFVTKTSVSTTSRTSCGAFGCISQSKHLAYNIRCVLRME